MSDGAVQRDYFHRARLVAVALLVVAGAAAIAGSALDWITIVVRPQLDPEANFGTDAEGLEQPSRTLPFSGLDAGDGWWVLAGGAVLVLAAALLWLRPQGRYAWLALLASMVIGAVAFADYRGVSDLSSSISQRMEIVGRARPALGLTLVAVAGFLGIVGSATAIAATPARE